MIKKGEDYVEDYSELRSSVKASPLHIIILKLTYKKSRTGDGDVLPIDVYSCMPIMCEDAKLPYCYVPARVDLGLASQTMLATSVCSDD